MWIVAKEKMWIPLLSSLRCSSSYVASGRKKSWCCEWSCNNRLISHSLWYNWMWLIHYYKGIIFSAKSTCVERVEKFEIATVSFFRVWFTMSCVWWHLLFVVVYLFCCCRRRRHSSFCALWNLIHTDRLSAMYTMHKAFGPFAR